MKKYILSILTIALFTIGFTASDEDENPYENFAGTYELYDDWNVGPKFIVVDDGRLFQVNPYSENNKIFIGEITPISDKAFEINNEKSISGMSEIVSYRNNNTCIQHWEIPEYSQIIFDTSEKRMYISEEDYKNRDYTSPEYYKFKFTK